MWEKIATVLVILAVIITAILGCWVVHEMLIYEPDPNYVPPEKPHLYWKDIDVIITDIQKDRSLNNRFLRVTVTVKSKEYNLKEDFIFEGNWYYLGDDGVMQTGWQYIEGNWYYLAADGIMQTGWKNYQRKWYHLGEDGVMSIGWTQLDGNWYYFNPEGIMLTGTQIIDGKRYVFNHRGVWVN